MTTLEKFAEMQKAVEREYRIETVRVLVEAWNARAKVLADRLLSEAGR